MAGREWEPSISRIHNFADEEGVIGHYQEFDPDALPGGTYIMSESKIIADLLQEGMRIAGVLSNKTESVTTADEWIHKAGQFLESYGIAPAEIHIPEGWPRPGIPHVEEIGNGTVVKTGAVIAPEPQPVEPAESGEHDQASS